MFRFRPSGRLLAAILFVSIAFAGPAAAMSVAPSIPAKDKLKLDGQVNRKESGDLAIALDDDGRFTIRLEGETWSGKARGKRRNRKLDVDFDTLESMERALLEELRELTGGGEDGPETREIREALAKTEERIVELRNEVALLERQVARLERLAEELGVESSSALVAAREELGRAAAQLEAAQKRASELAASLARSGGGSEVSAVRVRKVEARLRFDRKRTKVKFAARVRFEATVDGQRRDGVRKLSGRGPVFEVSPDEVPAEEGDEIPTEEEEEAESTIEDELKKRLEDLLGKL